MVQPGESKKQHHASIKINSLVHDLSIHTAKLCRPNSLYHCLGKLHFCNDLMFVGDGLQVSTTEYTY